MTKINRTGTRHFEDIGLYEISYFTTEKPKYRKAKIVIDTLRASDIKFNLFVKYSCDKDGYSDKKIMQMKYYANRSSVNQYCAKGIDELLNFAKVNSILEKYYGGKE